MRRNKITFKDVQKAYYRKMMGCDVAKGHDFTVSMLLDLSNNYRATRPRKHVDSKEVQWEPAQIEGEVK